MMVKLRNDTCGDVPRCESCDPECTMIALYITTGILNVYISAPSMANIEWKEHNLTRLILLVSRWNLSGNTKSRMRRANVRRRMSR